jgi:predicted amidohydrolase
MKFGNIVRNGKIVDKTKCVYDLVLRGGRIIDPQANIDKNGDIYIRDGKITAPFSSEAQACTEIDASGCIVTPGLLDSHIHVFENDGEGGLKADLLCIPSGVTSVVDGGSAGAINFFVFNKTDIVPSSVRIKALLNICSNGMISLPYGENLDPAFFDEDEIINLFKRYPEVIAGIKVRLGLSSSNRFGLEPLKAAAGIVKKIRETQKCVLEIHATSLPESISLDAVLSYLEKGDIFVHMYHGHGEGILDKKGKIRDSAVKARERGVLFDCCGGRLLFSLDIIKKAYSQGFYPDLIATDVVSTSLYRKPAFSLPNIMSVYYNLGMKLNDLIKAVTQTPARAFGFSSGIGTLSDGAPADIAVIKILKQKTETFDCFGQFLTMNEIIVPMLTIKDGRVLFRQVFFQDEF